MRARLVAVGIAVAVTVAGCGTAGSQRTVAAGGADLSGFATQRITVGGVEFEVWVAETPAQRAQGLMFATLEQLAPLGDGTPRGMLFVFTPEVLASFFMRDTFVPLDLAYVGVDGLIDEIHELIPLDETLVESTAPVAYALEVPVGTLRAFGITVGDPLSVP